MVLLRRLLPPSSLRLLLSPSPPRPHAPQASFVDASHTHAAPERVDGKPYLVDVAAGTEPASYCNDGSAALPGAKNNFNRALLELRMERTASKHLVRPGRPNFTNRDFQANSYPGWQIADTASGVENRGACRPSASSSATNRFPPWLPTTCGRSELRPLIRREQLSRNSSQVPTSRLGDLSGWRRPAFYGIAHRTSGGRARRHRRISSTASRLMSSPQVTGAIAATPNFSAWTILRSPRLACATG